MIALSRADFLSLRRWPPPSAPARARSPRAQRELGATWVREYARQYAETHLPLTAADVEPIARGQIAGEDAARGPLVILDTDLISTVVYARHYYGACPRGHPGRARDSGDDAREDLFDAFRAAQFETRWGIVSGEWEARWERLRALASSG